MIEYIYKQKIRPLGLILIINLGRVGFEPT